ncbi:MAG: histidine kinase [Gammaproteobacteria bacterium]|nr:MAG: histidine kinase [Gammaproteobacteria bacterium]
MLLGPIIYDSKLALVVDDSKMQCMMLSVLLQEEGYRVIIAHDGACGVAMYIEHQPDLVLMDINMPIMNGYEAARQIKKISHGSLAPLIFITSMDTDQAFIESVDAGGDSILVRPFTPAVFKAKIKAIQRVSDLYSQIKILQQEQQKDEELAEQLLTGVIGARNYAKDKIGIVKKSAAIFSGDIQLTALCPNGDVYILLGDFTGHGLRSSIGAIPLAETFRTMTKKGFLLNEIIKQINYQLYDLLPADLFLAACFVRVSSNTGSAKIFNAGLPDTYILSCDQLNKGQIKYKIGSIHPPLGILPELLPKTKAGIYAIEKSDRIILISDGVIEARNSAKEMYDIDRLEQCIIDSDFSQNIAVLIMQSVNEFCQGNSQEDDISIIDVPCNLEQEAIIATNNNNDKNDYSIEETIDQTTINEKITDDKTIDDNILAEHSASDDFTVVDFDLLAPPVWFWQLSLYGERLGQVNPIPLAMNQIQAIEGSGEHWHSLYTILTELFINALDHGVLELSSELKNSPQGFVEYFTIREQRLAKLIDGFIDIQLSYHLLDSGGRMVIKVKDSGKGFDSLKAFKNNSISLIEKKTLSGRGLELVNQLTETIEYQDNGTLVKASYVWDQNNS